MTAEWDNIQRLITALGTLKDPDLYEAGLRYLQDIFYDIHEFDHGNNQMIAKFLSRRESYMKIKKLLQEALKK